MKFKINFPEKISYRMNLKGVTSPEMVMKPEMIKNVLKSQEKFTPAGYRFETTKLDENLLLQFSKIYHVLIHNIVNGVPQDIVKIISARMALGNDYWFIGLYQHDQLLGGEIYSIKPTRVALAYKALPHKLDVIMRAGPGLMIDYELIKNTIALQKEDLSLGRDRNVYGLNLNIGLLNYKLSIGYDIHIADHNEKNFSEFDWDEKTTVCIIGSELSPNKLDAIFLFSKEDLTELKIKFPNLWKYPKLPLKIYS